MVRVTRQHSDVICVAILLGAALAYVFWGGVRVMEDGWHIIEHPDYGKAMILFMDGYALKDYRIPKPSSGRRMMAEQWSDIEARGWRKAAVDIEDAPCS